MVIQHNIAAINSHRNLGINNAQTNKNLEKLSSGYRINRAGDDAAGLAISEKMRGQIRGLAMAEQNTSNGISLIQTAEGGLNETHAILQRMRELAVQASNGTYQDEDRLQIDLEMDALKSEIDRIATSTHYNGIKLLDGNLDANGFSISASDMTAAELGLTDVEVTGVGGGGSFTINAGDTYDIQVLRQNDGTFRGTGTAVIGGKKYELTCASDNVTWTIEDSQGDGTVDATFKLDLSGAIPTNGYTLSGTFSKTFDEGDTGESNGIAGVQCGQFADGDDLIFQIGANGTADQQVSMSVRNMSSAYIGIWDTTTNALDTTRTIADIDVRTREHANAAIAIIDGATNMVSSQRAELGALQNRLEHTLNNLGVTKENLTAAESTIRDVDMAKEMMEFTKNSILVQASQAMLAQANQLPQGVLSLLR